METIGPSLRCPECHYGLFTAAFLNFGFFGKSNCPYCGSAIRWSLKPFLAILFGIISSGTGVYLLGEKNLLPVEFSVVPATLTAVGVCLVLLGLLTLRFELIKKRVTNRHYAPVRHY